MYSFSMRSTAPASWRWTKCMHIKTVAKDYKAIEFLDNLKNYERLGVPAGAGTNSHAGFDLKRMTRLVKSLGDPLSSVPVVHVAGTKGKGSTVAFVSNILRAAGYSVGTYTSPHIRSLHERITAGKMGNCISADAFESLFSSVQGILEDAISAEAGSLTYFEVLTALAFKYFEQEKVDIAVVETGLGGIRDATNVIPPEGLACAVITSIGEEHMEALGGSVEQIALAKAGIIKNGRPVVLSRQTSPVAASIVQDVARLHKAFLISASNGYSNYTAKEMRKENEDYFNLCNFLVNSGFQLPNGPLNYDFSILDCKLRMFGVHQLENAMAAIYSSLCLRTQGWEITNQDIKFGLEDTVVPGRFQILSPAQSRKLGLQGATVILDGAHTEASAAALADTLRSLFPDEHLALIVAMASDKNHEGFASSLLSAKPMLTIVTEVSVAGSTIRTKPKTTLFEGWHRACCNHNLHVQTAEMVKYQQTSNSICLHASETINSSLELAGQVLQTYENRGVVCVTGSLHAISEAMAQF